MANVLTGQLGDRSGRMFLVLAVIFAVVTGALIYAGLRGSGGDDEGGAKVSGDAVPVVVAASDIRAGQEITEGMLEVKSVPASVALAGAFEDQKDVVGLNAATNIEAGDQLTPSKVSQYAVPSLGEDVKAPSLVVPKGMRGFSVPVTEVTGVGGLLLPGDRVDVIAVFEEGENFATTKAVVVLQDVQVISVAQEALEPAAGVASEAGEGEGEAAAPAPAEGETGVLPEDVENQPSARQVVLAVTPQDAALLALIQEQATIYVSLRRQGDRDPIAGALERDLAPYGYTPTPNE